jgi:hypothetical protein
MTMGGMIIGGAGGGAGGGNNAGGLSEGDIGDMPSELLGGSDGKANEKNIPRFDFDVQVVWTEAKAKELVATVLPKPPESATDKPATDKPAEKTADKPPADKPSAPPAKK